MCGSLCRKNVCYTKLRSNYCLKIWKDCRLINSASFWQILTFMKPPDYRELFGCLGYFIRGLNQKLATFFELWSPGGSTFSVLFHFEKSTLILAGSSLYECDWKDTDWELIGRALEKTLRMLLCSAIFRWFVRFRSNPFPTPGFQSVATVHNVKDLLQRALRHRSKSWMHPKLLR